MQSKKIAICGVLCALATVIMMLGSFLGVATYAAPMFAIWLLLPIQNSYGNKTALTAFFACAIIGLLLLPDRELAVVYCAFGWWPVARIRIQKIRPGLLRFIVKLVIYLVVSLAAIVITVGVLGIVYSEEGTLFAPIKGLPLPVTPADLATAGIGALIFLAIDYILEPLGRTITAKMNRFIKF